jgi:phosphate transport system substrate-binding protein
MAFFARRILATLVALGFCGSASAEDITGAGSTFVFPILSMWSADYGAAAAISVKYQSIGSRGGVAQVKSAAVDFGATDAPLRPDDLQKSGLGQFPLVIGGIVPVLNVEGVKPGELRFTGPLLSDIFLGKVKMWNDRAIADLNPDVKLPTAAIVVVHRTDGSGTTFNWTNYLSKVSGEWRSKIGEGTAVDWPVGAGRSRPRSSTMLRCRQVSSAKSRLTGSPLSPP